MSRWLALHVGPLEFAIFPTAGERAHPWKHGLAAHIAWEQRYEWSLLASIELPPHVYVRGLSREACAQPERDSYETTTERGSESEDAL